MDSSKFTDVTKARLKVLAMFGVCGFSQHYQFDIISAILTENKISYRFLNGKIIWIHCFDKYISELINSLAA